MGTPEGKTIVGSEKGHPVGCPVLLLFGDLALVFRDGGRQLLEVRLDQAGLVERDQRAPVDALRQFVGSGLNLMAGELRHGVVQAPEVAGLVLAVRRIVPDELDLVHIAVSNDLGLGQVVEDGIPLIVFDGAFSQAAEDAGAILEALNSAANNVHKARNVQLVRMLLSEAKLVGEALEAVGADKPEHAHLKRDATGAVERVVENQAQTKLVAHLGHLDELILEVVLDIDASAVAFDVSLAAELAQLVVGEGGLDGFDQRGVLNQRVAFSANAQHGLGIGAAVSHPAGMLAFRSEQRDRLDRIVELVGRGSE